MGTVGQAQTLALADRYGVAYTRSACSIPERTNAAERYRFHRVQRAFVELLGPSALLFDDVQWADDASLELLLHLLTRPPEVPHLLVFALRPATVAAPLLDAARRRADFEELSLGPPDDAAGGGPARGRRARPGGARPAARGRDRRRPVRPGARGRRRE